MQIREADASDLPGLTELTIRAFRPLFEEHWPALLHPTVFSHDHGQWEAAYRVEVPALHDPDKDRFVTLAEEDGQLLGYVGWHIAKPGSGRLQLVAVDPEARRRGVGRALCQVAIDELRARDVVVVHVGTGGDPFHEPARRLYESLGFSGMPVMDYTQAL